MSPTCEHTETGVSIAMALGGPAITAFCGPCFMHACEYHRMVIGQMVLRGFHNDTF